MQVVLDKFQDDPLKHRAAVFLIENLPFHYSYEGEALNDYLKLFELHGKGTMYPDKVLDSIKRACGPFHMDRLEAKSDIYIDPYIRLRSILPNFFHLALITDLKLWTGARGVA